MSDLTVELFVLADYVTLSKENKLTIAGIFDRFFTASVPTKWPTMYLAAILRGIPNTEHKLRLRIDSEHKKKIVDQELNLKLGDNGKMNFITGLNNFPLESFGKYRMSLLSNNDEIGEVVFSVEKRLQPEETENIKLPN